MMYSPSRLAVIMASCLVMSWTSAVEIFYVTTNLLDKDSGKTEKLQFSICLNENVVDVVADEFIDFAQTISPEFSSMAEQVESLKNLVCNEHTSDMHPSVCESNTPAKFVDPVNPFSSVNLQGETYRISVREGQTAEELTDCFCSKNSCSYHQGKHIEEALATKIADSQKQTDKKKINIKSPTSDKSSSDKKSTKKK
mmetsp:Transcript_17926/g.29990  ORF Transcript_17926/g.29990 Transcript_17926/m.29990 type:complete len:197 (+) Transcript_17926:34-624(+)